MKRGAFPPRVREAMWEREAGHCGICARNVMKVGSWSFQHRRARGAGGSRASDTPTVVNGVLLCGSATTHCHGYVEGHGSWAISTGYKVPQGCDPALVPIWIARMGWVLLETWGGYQLVDDPHPEETRVLEAFSRARLDAP